MNEDDTFEALRRISREQVFHLFRAAGRESNRDWTPDEVRDFFIQHGWTVEEYNNSIPFKSGWQE